MIRDRRPISSFFLPSVSDLIILAFFFTWILFHSLMQNFDIWFHLRTGELIRSGVFPHVDVFSFTAAGRPWIVHEWGSDVIFSWLYGTFGVVALIALRAVIVAVTIGTIFKILVRSRINIFLSILLALAAAEAFRNSFLIRPQLFSYMFFAFVFYIYNEYKLYARKSLLYFLPLIFVAWINLHGGFIVGFILLGLFIIGETADHLLAHKAYFSTDQAGTHRLTIFCIFSFLLCLANPNTYRGLLYPLLYNGQGAIPLYSIAEWWPASWGHNPVFFLLVLLLIVVVALSKSRLKFYQLFPIAFFVLYTFKYNRLSPYFATVTLAFTGVALQEILKEYYWKITAFLSPRLRELSERFSRYLAGRSSDFLQIEETHRYHVPLILVLIFCVAILLTGRLNSALAIGVSWNRFPTGNIKVLKAYTPKGNIFNQYRWGGILIKTFPHRKVFIDGRMDVYRQKFADEYDTVMELHRGWRQILARYDITHILVDKNSTIARFLTHLDPNWLLVSTDRNSDLFFRKKPYKNPGTDASRIPRS